MKVASEEFVQRLARPDIIALTPYASARREAAGGIICLNANESPWNNTSVAGVNRYPDCQPEQLRRLYADYACVRPRQVLISRGADEAIDLLMRAFCRPGIDRVASCSPSYGMYTVSAATNGVACQNLEWAEGYQLPEDFDQQVQGAKLVFVCNPNNPSGTVIAPEILVKLAARLPDSLLIVDEAYIEFCPEFTVTDALDSSPNLVVLRTLSKAFALAGARCGFVVASEAVIAILEKVIAPYPVPAPVVQLAEDALSVNGISRMQCQVNTLIACRDTLYQKLSENPAVLDVIESETNFILFKLSSARSCYQALAEQGIFIRAYNNPALTDWLRISIGKESEMQLFETSLNRVLL